MTANVKYAWFYDLLPGEKEPSYAVKKGICYIWFGGRHFSPSLSESVALV